jgi:hypothetical protein
MEKVAFMARRECVPLRLRLRLAAGRCLDESSLEHMSIF